jgi:hypothetical protein
MSAAVDIAMPQSSDGSDSDSVQHDDAYPNEDNKPWRGILSLIYGNKLVEGGFIP